MFFPVAYIQRYLLLVSAFSENIIPQCSPALVNHFLSFQKSESNKHYEEKNHERKYCNRYQQVAQKSENDLFKLMNLVAFMHCSDDSYTEIQSK